MYHIKYFSTLLFVGICCLYMLGCKEDQSPTDNTNVTVDSTASKQKSDLAYTQIETEMSKMITGNYNTPAQYDQLKFREALSLYNEAHFESSEYRCPFWCCRSRNSCGVR